MTSQADRVRWRKSSRSGGTNGNCVELAHTFRAVRDSKNGHVLTADARQLVTAVKDDQFGRRVR